jgi:uncharacterized damage-inducible protein DinB
MLDVNSFVWHENPFTLEFVDWSSMEPEPDECPARYQRYLELVPELRILEAIELQTEQTSIFLEGLSATQAYNRYAPEKWSVKEVLGHVIDVERIFSMRALRFSRGDLEPRMDWNFDRMQFVQLAGYHTRSWTGLIAEFSLLRQANLLAFLSIKTAILMQRGVANHDNLSVRALLYILLGHERHHFEQIKKLYLS